MTAVPLEVAVQKLRGFIADQNAKIVKTNENELQLGSHRRPLERESPHGPIGRSTFLIHLKLSQTSCRARRTRKALPPATYVETRIDVAIRPRRDRDRRREATVDKARRLLGSLKSYLMAREDDGKPADAEVDEPRPREVST